jgi:hypothetical protein
VEFTGMLTVQNGALLPLVAKGSMRHKRMLRDAYVLACTLQHQLRGKRRKYAKRAWSLARHLNHWPDGAYKGAAFAFLVLLVVAALTSKPGRASQ